jgi:hypothetical protein
MKNSFSKVWKIYLILLSILSILFWVYMIYDDWIFVKEYGFNIELIWIWCLWYLGYCFLGFSVYFWVLTSFGIFIYHKFILKQTENKN